MAEFVFRNLSVKLMPESQKKLSGGGQCPGCTVIVSCQVCSRVSIPTGCGACSQFVSVPCGPCSQLITMPTGCGPCSQIVSIPCGQCSQLITMPTGGGPCSQIVSIPCGQCSQLISDPCGPCSQVMSCPGGSIKCPAVSCPGGSRFELDRDDITVNPAEGLAVLKQQLQEALVEVEAQESALEAASKPKSVEEIDELKKQLLAAVEELDEQRAAFEG